MNVVFVGAILTLSKDTKGTKLYLSLEMRWCIYLLVHYMHLWKK